MFTQSRSMILKRHLIFNFVYSYVYYTFYSIRAKRRNLFFFFCSIFWATFRLQQEQQELNLHLKT
jgi:hypothetical protein